MGFKNIYLLAKRQSKPFNELPEDETSFNKHHNQVVEKVVIELLTSNKNFILLSDLSELFRPIGHWRFLLLRFLDN